MKRLSNLFLLLFIAVTMSAQQVIISESTTEKMAAERQKSVESSQDNQQLLFKSPDFRVPANSPMNFSSEEAEILSWDNGNIYTGIGGSTFDLDVASRFEPSDLQNVAGHFLTAIEIFTLDEMDLTLKVWQGPIGDNTEIYAQEVDEFVVGELNSFELLTPIEIDITQEFWIGYSASVQEGFFPLGTDDGPAVEFKGDMLRLPNSDWESLFESYHLDYNWIIRGQAEILANPQAPESPQNLIVEAAPGGSLSATINWDNPSQTFGGDPLTELTEIVIERDNEVIGTITNPEIGGLASFEDNTISASGNYNYKIYGVNSFGNGVFATATVYVGIDIPAAPLNAQLEVSENDGVVSWEAPTEGINGGFINTDEISYTVKRFPDEVVVAQGLTSTEFIDTQIPGPGNYFYTITAANQMGEGGTATSNVAVLGADGLLMFETFEYATGDLPPGWTVSGVPVNWKIYPTSYAGGEPNELNLNWAPQSSGLSRLITYPISTGDMDIYRLRFKQMFEIFSGFSNDVIGIDVTFDDGQTWETLWEYVISTSIPAGEFQVPISIPEEATIMHLGFRFEGSTFNMENWFLDDMFIEPVLDNDLAGLSIEGPGTLSEGFESTFTVNVLNNGSATQSNYSVKLFKNGTEEIGTVSGNPIEAGEQQSYDFLFTPSAENVGNITLSGFVEFTGDELPSNNFTNSLNAEVFPEGIIPVQIGEDEEIFTSLPYDFSWEFSLSQTLYYADEVGFPGGAIYALGYQAIFLDNKPDQAIQIWMGETDREDLTDGWVDPSTLQLVFDGTVDFPEGTNDITITLDQPYVYTGGNLVIYSYKADDDWSFNNYFASSFDINTPRSISAIQDNTPFDPVNPPAPHPASTAYPNTTLFLDLSGLGSLAGTVTDGENALEGVKVTLDGVSQPAFTDADGTYEFPSLISRTYTAQYEKFGFETLTVEDIVVEADSLTVQDAELTAIPQFTVTGTLQGNDGNLIGGAEITLEGYTPGFGNATLSEADGTFAMEDVFQGMYMIMVNAFGYEPFSSDSIVVDGDLDLGVILLQEQIEAPFNLMVMNEGLEPGQALFSWNNPLTGWEESFEDGTLPDEWSQIITNTGSNAGLPATWTVTGPVEIYNTIIDPRDGNNQVFMMWDFNEQDEWLITREFTVPAGDLQFWYYGFTGSTFGDNYYVKISTDEGQSWDILWNASNLPFSQNFYQEPVNINLDMYAGQKARIAWHNEDGPGDFGMWYFWAIDDISIGDQALNLTNLMTVQDPENNGLTNAQPLGYKSSGPEDLNGFNVFLDGEQVASGETSTQFLFDGLADGEYTAGVQAVFTTGVSDITEIDFVVDDTRLLSLVANPAGSGTLLGASWYAPGTEVLINATPEDDFQFVNWTDESGTIISEVADFFFTMPDGDIVLIANFAETESLNLTFVIDMTGAGNFDPENAMVNITGSMHGWNVLGNMAREQALMQVDNTMDFTITLELEPGTYEYAYFMNEGELDDEWENIPNRQIELFESTTVYDTWGNITSVSNAETSLDATVYPNPFGNFIEISANDKIERIEITNLLGSTMLTTSVASERIDTSDLSPGVYLVYLHGENGNVSVQKMIRK